MSYARASFDIANAYGQQGEAWVTDVLHHLATGAGAVEVKRKSRQDATFYVEIEALRGGEWQPSGLSTTLATVWFFVVNDTGCAAVFTTERLKDAVRRAHARGRHRTVTESATQPTRGFLLSWGDILAETSL